MVHYDKKVIYLSEMEYGNKRKGAGFVRMECRGESCSFDMHVSGMGTLAERKYDVAVISVRGKEYLIGEIFIHNGNGSWSGIYEKGRVTAGGEEEGDKGLPYREIAEILVKISDTKVLMGKTPFCGNVMQAAEMTAEEKTGETGKRSGNTAERNPEDKERERGIWKFVRGGAEGADSEWKGDRQEKHSAGKGESGEALRREIKIQKDSGNNGKNNSSKDNSNINNGGKNSSKDNSNMNNGSKNSSKDNSNVNNGSKNSSKDNSSKNNRKNSGKEMAGAEGNIQIDDVILDDKWAQLKQIYSVVHPYEDDRQYIAIQPKDFVIMTGDYQHLANNSFLLHGFYNYRHIVLGRERDGCFYLGVPGVYYEREKMVALMFGFEAFECTGGNAEAGKFGYYLRKVKI